MKLDYESLFSEIDKAKKKRWTQADTDKWTKQQKEEKEEPKSREQIGESFTRVPGRKRGKQVGDKKQSEYSTRVTGRKRGKGKKNLGTEHETRKPEKEEIRRRREAADAKRKQEEKDAKETYTGVKGDFPPASHDTSSSKPSGRVVNINIPKHIKGLGGKKQYHTEKPKTKIVTDLKPKDTVQKKPLPRKSKLRQESGGYAIKDPKEGQEKIDEADRKFQKERDTMSITSFTEFLRDRKKNPPASGGFVSAEESDKESETADYKKWVAGREASAKKREEDKKARESIDPKTKLPKGSKVKPKPKKEQPKVEAYQSEGDPNPEVEGGIDGDDEYSEYEKEGMKEKSLWKSWLKNKVSMSRMKRPEEYEGKETIEEKWNKGEQEKRRTNPKVQVETREGESYKKYKERQDAAEDPREHKTLTQQLDDMGVTNNPSETPERTQYPDPPKPATSAPTPKPATSTPSDGTSGGFVQDEDDYKNLGKALWKSWLKEKDSVDGKQSPTRKPSPHQVYTDDDESLPMTRQHPRVAKPRKTQSILDGDFTSAWGEDSLSDGYLNTIDNTGRVSEERVANHPNEAEQKEIDAKNQKELDKHKITSTIEQETDKESAERRAREWNEERKKAEEGMGGMNMGSQRGLGHEAGYKQSPGQSAQITEVKEEKEKKKDNDSTEWHKKSPDKCVDCGKKGRKGNTVYPTYVGDDPFWDGEEDVKDLVPLCENCSLRRNHPEMFHDQGEYSKETKEENKSAYENHEQDESPDSQPNKQQIPASKPGMDALKMYKKALIIKYNNIYKPANI